MQVLKGLKKRYKNLSWYNRDRLLEANCKTRGRRRGPGLIDKIINFIRKIFKELFLWLTRR